MSEAEQLLEWSDELYGCGHATIDGQHRELFDRLNALWAAASSDWDEGAARELFDFLARYLIEHFQDEERLMDEVRCPTRERNRLEHDQFIRVFRYQRGRFEVEGPTDELLSEMRRILLEWFSNHVAEVDGALRGCDVDATRVL